MLVTSSDDDVGHSPEVDTLLKVFRMEELHVVGDLAFENAESAQVATWQIVKWRDSAGGFVEAEVGEYSFGLLSHEQLMASILDETI